MAFISAGECEVLVGGKSARQIFPDSQVAALAEAAASGRIAEVKRLVESGVPVDGLGNRSATPLLFAMLAKNSKGMEALLGIGANPNHHIDDPVNVGGTPLPMLLANTEAVDLMDVLLKHGANVNTRKPVLTSNIKEFPYQGAALLYEAVMYKPMVELLVKYGAQVNLRSQGGDTAAVRAAGLGQLDVLEILLDHGANDFTDLANTLQWRIWDPRLRPRLIKILERLHAAGAKIYAWHLNPDTPAHLISPGKWQYKEYEGEEPVKFN